MSKRIGQEIENIALKYLLNQNLVLIIKNYYSRYGEIDLIMQDHNTLVFIEIRYRRNAQYGHPIESVTYRKKCKIYRTALSFLAKNPKFKNIQYRFDVVTLLGDSAETTWYKNIITEEILPIWGS
ncbi:MAG: YraN family protein [Gammaproteobacteria bacterium]|nr:YraN family protein [Gammaproteobacteria bacterium]